MATRTEKRFGETTGLGTAYTQIGPDVPASTTWVTHFNITNRTASTTVKLRLYIADTSWTTGEPTGGTLKTALAYDTPIAAGEVVQISGVVVLTTEQIVARSDTATSLDIALSGVEIV